MIASVQSRELRGTWEKRESRVNTHGWKENITTVVGRLVGWMGGWLAANWMDERGERNEKGRLYDGSMGD